MKTFITCTLLLAVSPTLTHAAPQCVEWSEAFLAPGADGPVLGLLRHDDGTGEVLYVGGSFTSIAGTPARNLARWDGTSWSALGDGPTGPVHSIAVYDDGSGPMVYAALNLGRFERFDGVSWSSIPIDGYYPFVRELEVHDDGNGNALYVCGRFSEIAGVPVGGLARYDGSWSAMGVSPHNFIMWALESHDDGAGSKLYVAGEFVSLGGVAASHIARWDGSGFEPLGSGLQLGNAWELQSYDDGVASAPGLYVAGDFLSAGGVNSNGLVRWIPNGWQGLATGPISVHGMEVLDDGSGPVLYVADEDRMVTWDGSTLASAPFTEQTSVSDLQAFDDGSGETLFAGHSNYQLINFEVPHVPNQLVRWDAGSWSTVSPGLGLGLGGGLGRVSGLHVHDLGSGPRLIASGPFWAPDGFSPGVAMFDGNAWTSLGSSLRSFTVRAFTSFDDGSGDALYAAGNILWADDGAQPHTLARLEGTEWVGLGTALPGQANVLASFREGSSTNLFMAGDFGQIDSTAYDRIARWDGSDWSDVGGGLSHSSPSFAEVGDLVVHDDGSGLALYAAGTFDDAGGAPVANVARWDGTSWSAVGAGLPGIPDGPAIVADLEVYDSPAGELLVAAGRFEVAGGAAANGIAMWDGTSWSALGAGLAGTMPHADSLASFDPDGNGDLLYVTGPFQNAGGLEARGGAIWNGIAWSGVLDIEGRSGESGVVNQLVAFDDGTGRGLYMGGDFVLVGGTPSLNIARLADPCGADVGLPLCTSLSNSTGERGLMRARGSASLAAEDLTLSARGLPGSAGTLFFHGPRSTRVVFGEGLRCVGGAVTRIYPIGQAMAGVYDLGVDYGAPYASNYAPGNTLLFQGWYRDGVGGPAGFNTTDALEITFRP